MALRPQFRTVKPLEGDKIHYALTCIGNEAMAAYHPNVKVINKLSDTFEGIASFMRTQLKDLANIPASLTMSKLDKILQGYPYTELMDFRLPCVAGQTVDWNSLMSQLEHHLQLILEMPERVFKPFSTYVGSALNDPTKLNSVTFRSTLRTADTAKLRKEYAAIITDNGVDKTTFGRLVSRNNDWPLAHTRLNKIIEASKAVPPETVELRIREINEVLMKLFAAIQDPSTNYQPTSVVITQLIDLIDALAEEVALYALFVNLVNRTATAMKEGEKLLEKSF